MVSHTTISEVELRRAMEVIIRNSAAKDIEYGALEACMSDVPEGVEKLLQVMKLLSRGSISHEQLLDAIHDMEMEMLHMRDHLQDAAAALADIYRQVERKKE